MQKMLTNIANSNGGLQHANNTALTDAQLNAVTPRDAPSRRRAPQVDDDGMKLSRVPVNNFDEFSPEMQAWYRSHGVEDATDYRNKVGDRVCTLCPRDNPNMPHREKQCPTSFASGDGAAKVLSKVSLARHQQRYADLIGGGKATYALLAERAMEEGDGSYEACQYCAEVLNLEDEEVDADEFVNAAYEMRTDAVTMVGRLK